MFKKDEIIQMMAQTGHTGSVKFNGKKYDWTLKDKDGNVKFKGEEYTPKEAWAEIDHSYSYIMRYELKKW